MFSSPTTRKRACVFGVLAIVVVAFLPSLRGGFIADDFPYIARFRELPWSEFPRLFTRDWSGGIWGQPLRELRPFVALSFMGDSRLFGGDPTGYRLTNLLLHLVSTFLVMRLAWRYSAPAASIPSTPSIASIAAPTDRPRTLAMLTAGLVFGLHPAHAEAVAWITGRVDVQATTAALLFLAASESFSAGGRPIRAVLAWLAFGLGIFSKELCLFAPLLLLLRWVALDLRAGRAVWLRRAALFAGIALLLLGYSACRRAAFGHDSIGYNLWTDAPAWERQAHYAGWLVPLLPFTTKGEWQNLPPIAALHALWLAIAIASIAGFLLARWRRAITVAAVFFFGGIWYLVTVFPMTGVVYFTPRHLYFPSVGMALAAGLLVLVMPARRAVAAALVAWCLAGHVFALRPWMHSASVSRAAVTAVDRELAVAKPGTLLITSVPETSGPTLLWAWSSPQCVSPPFVAHRAARVIERPANYIRPELWGEHKPLETLRAAPSVVALHVDAAGRLRVRRLEGAALQKQVEAFAQLVAAGRLNPDTWSEWVAAAAASD